MRAAAETRMRSARCALICVVMGAAACSYDWDALDERLGNETTGGVSGTIGSGGSAEGGVAGAPSGGLAGAGAASPAGQGGSEGGTSGAGGPPTAGAGGEESGGSAGAAAAGTGGEPTGGMAGQAGGVTGGAAGSAAAGTGGQAGACADTHCGTDCVVLASDIDHCGGCDRFCSTLMVETLSCTDGRCDSTCRAGTANCTMPAAPAADNGCETSIYTSALNCGACGRECSLTQVDAVRCSLGLCTSSCRAGFLNCVEPTEPDPDDGCETYGNTSPADCGACGRACGLENVETPSCSAGICDSTCADPRFANCTRPSAPDADDGCETRTAAHSSCGACAPDQICRDSSCQPACDASSLSALFVVGAVDAGDPGLPSGAGDRAVYDWLAAVLGLSITVAHAPSAAAASADGMDLIVISSTVEAVDVADKFADLAIPAVIWESYVLDDFQLTGPTAGTDYGTLAAQTQVGFVDPCHPAAASLNGSTAVYAAGQGLQWGSPISGATVLATVDGDPTQAAVFVVDAGVTLYDGTPAPARRVALFYEDLGPSVATEDAVRLTLASVCWAVGL